MGNIQLNNPRRSPALLRFPALWWRRPAMLSFIRSGERGGIVLNDLRLGPPITQRGIAEHAVGKSAPWFILGVMLFFLCRSCDLTLKACGMFVARRRSLPGGERSQWVERLPSFPSPPLMFDYVLTGPDQAAFPPVNTWWAS